MRQLCLLAAALLILAPDASAWQGMALPRLRQEGRFVVDEQGNKINLHGFMFTPNSFFCSGKFKGGDVADCLRYTEKLFDIMSDTKRGHYNQYVRLHLDPCWTNDGWAKGEHDISKFSMDKFDEMMEKVHIPIIKLAAKYGLYAVVRPPGVCPHRIAPGDEYSQYLRYVWKRFTDDPYIKSAPHVMIELANEPVDIASKEDPEKSAHGAESGAAIAEIMQDLTDTIRANGFENMIWVAGLGYQSWYSWVKEYPIQGTNIGYAVHFYPGFLNTGSKDPAYNNADYGRLKKAWDDSIKPASDIAPMLVTELDWSYKPKTNAEGRVSNTTWGWGLTGTAKDPRAGINIKRVMDEYGNVGWNLCMGWLDDGDVENPRLALQEQGEQACITPTVRWFKEYARKNIPRKAKGGASAAKKPAAEPKRKAKPREKSVSDLGDGTFVNCVIGGDFPDPDVVRVGNKYYLLSTTMHHVPGATLLESDDLVNWSWCANPLERLADIDNCNLTRGKRGYGAGMWASALAYHKGTFYVLVNTFGLPGIGAVLLTAQNPHGPWVRKDLKRGFYDCGLLFDSDDKLYVVHGHPKIWISELDKDFNVVQEKFVVEGNHPDWHDTLEGNKIYHIGEWYYIYSTYGGWPSGQTCFRSKNIWGPYEEKLVISKTIDGRPNTVHQGVLIETPDGEWWSLLFQDLGAIGRCPNLQKVTWKDDWPTIGVAGDGRPEKRRAKPGRGWRIDRALPPRHLETTDAFRDYRLGLQWQWNHQPDDTKWSLLERPGWLRLKTASVTKNLYDARNTLTQRILTTVSADGEKMLPGAGTVKMDLRGMKDGDVAGLAVLQSPYVMIGVMARNGRKTLVWKTDSLETGEKAPKPKTLTQELPKETNLIYLRAGVEPESGRVAMGWSLDNHDYAKLGETVKLGFSLKVFVGMRYAIFNYATRSLGGSVDVDWFATGRATYDERFYYDSQKVVYDMEVVNAARERAAKLAEEATLEAREKNNLFSLRPNRIIKFFGNGTVDEKTGKFDLGLYGQYGWRYEGGLDLSTYQSLTVAFAEQPEDVYIRFYDNNADSIWGGKPATVRLNDRKCEIKFRHLTKEDGSPLDLKTIGVITLQSGNGKSFRVKSITLKP